VSDTAEGRSWDFRLHKPAINTAIFAVRFRAVVFNVGEIASLGTILCVVGAILWFVKFGGRFQFPGGRFLQV